MYRPIELRTPETEEKRRVEQDARNDDKLVHKDIGMVLGNLIAFRSCRVTLAPSIYDNPLKSDINVMAHDLGIKTLYLAAHGSIQRQDTRKPFTHKPPLRKVLEFAEQSRDDGLIVIYGTDYTDKSADGDPDSLSYFSEIINDRQAPMVCTIGHGTFDPVSARSSLSNELLTSLRVPAHIGVNGITEPDSVPNYY